VRPFTLLHVLTVRVAIVLLMAEAAVVAADAGVVDAADVPAAEAVIAARAVAAEAVAKLE